MEGVPLMVDVETLAVVTSLFLANYAGMWILYRRVDTFSTALRILCREHAKNHGLTEIQV
jgi:hypothetical protein